jgi:hypothetical protein
VEEEEEELRPGDDKRHGELPRAALGDGRPGRGTRWRRRGGGGGGRQYPEAAERAGRARRGAGGGEGSESFGEWLREELQRPEGEELRVSVGRDPRLSGARLSAALFAGLARAGCSVFDMGLATTPACFMSTILSRFNYDASIMVTLLSSAVSFVLLLTCYIHLRFSASADAKKQ